LAAGSFSIAADMMTRADCFGIAGVIAEPNAPFLAKFCARVLVNPVAAYRIVRV
jgi:hypothetical protein